VDIQLPQVKSLQENLKDLGLKEKSDALSENVKALNDNLRESTSKIEAPKIPKLKDSLSALELPKLELPAEVPKLKDSLPSLPSLPGGDS